MLTIYGIPNCDKCRAAQRWFKGKDIEHRFHDLREDGITASLLQRWLNQIEADELLNRSSVTWRNFSEKERNAATTREIIDLIQKHPTVIKRPVVDDGNTLIVGYDETRWKQHFRKTA